MHRAAAAGAVGLAELHPLALERLEFSIIIRNDSDGGGELHDLDPLGEPVAMHPGGRADPEVSEAAELHGIFLRMKLGRRSISDGA